MALDFSWHDGERVMFIGDAITEDPQGYTRIIPAMVTARYPERRIAYYPRGGGGNRIGDLLERLERDILGDLRTPTWVSMSVGLNDVWDSGTGTPLERFQQLYETMILRLLDWKSTVVCLTTTLKGEDLNSPDNQRLVGYNEAIRAIAFKYRVGVIDINRIFQTAIQQAQSVHAPFHYTDDGTRLNAYGHYLMTAAILGALHYALDFEGNAHTGYS